MTTLNLMPVWFALSLLRFRLPSRLPMMFILWMVAMIFFFQPEDGIRDDLVTGVQTCARPIYAVSEGVIPRGQVDELVLIAAVCVDWDADDGDEVYGNNRAATLGALRAGSHHEPTLDEVMEIGRASCRERGKISGRVGSWTKNR